jgi:hypothetical protein
VNGQAVGCDAGAELRSLDRKITVRTLSWIFELDRIQSECFELIYQLFDIGAIVELENKVFEASLKDFVNRR